MRINSGYLGGHEIFNPVQDALPIQVTRNAIAVKPRLLQAIEVLSVTAIKFDDSPQ